MRTASARYNQRDYPSLMSEVPFLIFDAMKPGNQNVTKDGWTANFSILGQKLEKTQDGYHFKLIKSSGSWDFTITGPEGQYLASFYYLKKFEWAVTYLETVYRQEKRRLKWHRLLTPFLPLPQYFYALEVRGHRSGE